jgi:hypothetical protein
MLVLLAVCWRGQAGRDTNRTNTINTYCCVYSVEVFLMMDSGPVQNMISTLSNKFEKLCISLAFITRIVLCIYRYYLVFVIVRPYIFIQCNLSNIPFMNNRSNITTVHAV